MRFKTRMLSLALPLLVSAAFAGCDNRDDLYYPSSQLDGPYAVAGQALWVEGETGRVFTLDPQADPLRVQVGKLGHDVVFSGVGGDQAQSSRLLVLTEGQRAEHLGEADELPALYALRPQAEAVPEVQSYELPVAFDRLAVAANGRWALAYLSDAADDTGSGLLHNPNQIAVVDLDAPVESALHSHTLRSFGEAPLAALISPPMMIGSAAAGRAFGVVLAPNLITLLDLEHPERSEVSVRLSQASVVSANDESSSAANVIPEQVLFAPQRATIYVRASGAEDVLAIVLQPRESTDAATNDFEVRINQPGVAGEIDDMLVVPDAERSLLLVAQRGQDLALVDVTNGEVQRVPIDSPVDSLAGAPSDAPQRVIAFDRGGSTAELQVIDLASLLDGADEAVTPYALGDRARDVMVTPDGEHALVIHDAQRAQVSIVDLADAKRGAAPLVGSRALESFTFVGSEYLVVGNSESAELGIVGLRDLQPVTVRLEEPPSSVLVVGDALVVDHVAPEGLVTVLPTPPIAADEGRMLWGLIYDGLLDRGRSE